jgi:hypothetical protein
MNGYERVFDKDYPQDAMIWSVQQRRSTFPSAKFQFMYEGGQLSPGRVKFLFLDDMPISNKSRISARVEEYLAGKKYSVGYSTHDVYVLRAHSSENEDAKHIKKLLDWLGNPSEIVKLSTLPEPARKVRTVNGTKTVRPKIRMLKYTGGRDRYGNPVHNLNAGLNKANVVTEIPEADQPTSGIVVVTDSWQFPDGFLTKMQSELIPWSDLVFITKGDYNQYMKDNFKTFDSVFDPLFKKYEKKFNRDAIGEYMWFDRHHHTSYFYTELVGLLEGGTKIPDDKKDTPFGKMAALYEKYEKPLTDEFRKAAQVLKIPMKEIPGVDLKSLDASARSQQPLATLMIDLLRYQSRGDVKHRRELFLRSL